MIPAKVTKGAQLIVNSVKELGLDSGELLTAQALALGSTMRVVVLPGHEEAAIELLLSQIRSCLVGGDHAGGPPVEIERGPPNPKSPWAV